MEIAPVSPDPERTYRPLGSIKLLSMVAVFGGLQLVWSLIIAEGSPYLKSLGLSDATTALTWLSAPLCGTFLPPFFGSWSDRTTTSWGRRRPFILAGSIATVVCVLVLAWVEHISDVVMYFAGYSSLQHGNGFTQFAAVGTVISLNIAISPGTVGTRALLADVVRAEEQERVNAWIAYSSSVGNIVGFCAGSLDLPKALNTTRLSQFQFLAILTSFMVLSTVTICILTTKEQMNSEDENSRGVGDSAWFSTITKLSSGYRTSSKRLKKVLLIQFCAWMAWFSFLFYGSSYVNERYSYDDARFEEMMTIQQNVKAGLGAQDPNPGPNDNFAPQRTQIGSAATLLYAMVALLVIVVLRLFRHRLSFDVKLQKHYDNKFNMMDVWGCSHILFASLMVSTFLIQSWQGSVIVIALVGIPWAATMWIPHAVVATEVSLDDIGDDVFRAHRGAILGLHNVAISVPQIFAAMLCSGILWLATTLGSSEPAAWTLRAGILPSILAAYFTFTIKEI